MGEKEAERLELQMEEASPRTRRRQCKKTAAGDPVRRGTRGAAAAEAAEDEDGQEKGGKVPEASSPGRTPSWMRSMRRSQTSSASGPDGGRGAS